MSISYKNRRKALKRAKVLSKDDKELNSAIRSGKAPKYFFAPAKSKHAWPYGRLKKQVDKDGKKIGPPILENLIGEKDLETDFNGKYTFRLISTKQYFAEDTSE